MHFIRLLVVLVVAPAAATVAQPADTSVAIPIAGVHFEEARAVAADPLGRLYVVDAGRDVVWRLSGPGLLERLGGPGTDDGSFDDPASIDPTNGLLLVVADAGNNRIQRFSREFRHMETLPVPRVDALSVDPARPSFRRVDPALATIADGRPISVAVSSADETFAVDADGGVVLKWDAGRRVRVIGGFADHRGQLAAPVDLALTAEQLYVADAGRAAVLVYDHFGGFVRMLADGQAHDVRAVAAVGDMIWIVLPRRILVYTATGRFVRDVAVVNADGQPLALVDVARAGNTVYAVDERHLYRLEGR